LFWTALRRICNGEFVKNTQCDLGIDYWKPFLERFSTLPEKDQLAIIEEYEKAERSGKEMNMELIAQIYKSSANSIKGQNGIVD